MTALPLRVIILLPVLVNANAATALPQDRPLAVFTALVDLGEDMGQHLGSVFEARDAQGRVIAGAGFTEHYNTRFRSNRRTLQFYVRAPGRADALTLERLPHPDLDCGVYLFDLDDKLYAWSSVRGNSVRRWQPTSRSWLDQRPAECGSIRSGDGVLRLGRDGLLAMSDNRVTYSGTTLLEAPRQGRIYNFYFARGHLFSYFTHRSDSVERTEILAFPWKPSDAAPLVLSQAVVMRTKYDGETPFAWGQFRGEVLTVSNMGGVYAFDGRSWRTLLEADHTVSYQVYSMLNYHDRLLLAQYPTGHLFEYRGKQLKQLGGWPPRLPGVSPHAREAQTMCVYGGDLLVGVWPWAELWRLDRDTKRWHSLGRMFTHAELTDKQVHPYEADSDRFGLVSNHWGQRVTAMVPQGDSLYISTSAKGTSAWDDKYDFLNAAQRREYGAVLRLKVPGNLAAQFHWTESPTKFEFLVSEGRMLIRQDGEVLGSAACNLSAKEFPQELETRWARGAFGQFSGRLKETKTH